MTIPDKLATWIVAPVALIVFVALAQWTRPLWGEHAYYVDAGAYCAGWNMGYRFGYCSPDVRCAVRMRRCPGSPSAKMRASSVDMVTVKAMQAGIKAGFGAGLEAGERAR